MLKKLEKIGIILYNFGYDLIARKLKKKVRMTVTCNHGFKKFCLCLCYPVVFIWDIEAIPFCWFYAHVLIPCDAFLSHLLGVKSGLRPV